MAKDDSRTDVTLDAERADCACVATYEIEQLADLIIKECSDDKIDLIYRGIATRIRALNNAVMSAIGEPDCPTEDIAAIVREGR